MRKKTVKVDKIDDKPKGPEIILGLDVSTVCIGCCIFLKDDSIGKIIKLTHITPKVSSKIKGIEQLFLKKAIFERDFLTLWKDKGITKVIIEEPLLSSNNVNTVATLLRFNGMISDSVFNVLGIVPEYISSYDARKYAFPELMSIRKFNKLGETYDKKTLISAVKKSKLVLFGGYDFDCQKKYILWNKISELYPEIDWILDKKGELKKENFDASDALVTCLAISNKLNFGELNATVDNYRIFDDHIDYTVKYWNRTENKKLIL